MKRKVALLLVTAFILMSCEKVYRYINETFFAMNTVVTVVAEETLSDNATKKIVSDFEERLSRTKPESEISMLNSGKDVTLSNDTLMIIEKSLEIARNTDYAFNPCMGAVADLWDITSGKNIVPDDEDIKNALSCSNANDVKIENKKVVLVDGMKIDLGGVAKGYALEMAAENMKEQAQNNNVQANFCISIGGNVAVNGSSESMINKDKSGWNVGITNPFDKTRILGTLLLNSGYVSVSGAYERFFEKDGKVYHHIFDSKTGYPAESDLASSVVVSENGLEADALSTALFVMGRDKAIEFYKNGIYDFEMMLVSENGTVFISPGIADKFTVDNTAKNKTNDSLTIITIDV